VDARTIKPRPLGTEWTEPGKGATVQELDAAQGSVRFDQSAMARRSLGDLYVRLANKVGTAKALATRTNLRLTGKPLTAGDVRRISEVIGAPSPRTRPDPAAGRSPGSW